MAGGASNFKLVPDFERFEVLRHLAAVREALVLTCSVHLEHQVKVSKTVCHRAVLALDFVARLGIFAAVPLAWD